MDAYNVIIFIIVMLRMHIYITTVGITIVNRLSVQSFIIIIIQYFYSSRLSYITTCHMICVIIIFTQRSRSSSKPLDRRNACIHILRVYITRVCGERVLFNFRKTKIRIKNNKIKNTNQVWPIAI